MKLLRKLTKCMSVLIFLYSGCTTSAQTSDIRQEIEELKQGQLSIQEELEEIKSLLERIVAPQARPSQAGPTIKNVKFDIGDNPVRGSASAKFILIEFTDYECPFCGRYVRDTLPQILSEYVDKGAIQYTVIDLPLPMHSKAVKAAEASHCAEDQGKFWEIHELMMKKQESLGDLFSYAATLKLDVAKFNECVGSGKYADAVKKDMALTDKLDINAVPGFIIGRVDPSNPGKITGISMIQGAVPFSNFKTEIDAAMAAR